MKKILTLLITLLMVFTLVGCNTKQEGVSTVDEPQVEEPAIVGGYVEADDKNLTPELIEMFEKAFEGFVGASYTPVMLEATQVVAGTNYKFKADGTKTTNPIIQGTYYVYINKDLQGNISLLDIEVIEEHELKKFEPEVKLDTEIKKDVTQMSFWVVFYDQYDNELQREALKYGTVPSFKGILPEGFDSWDKSLKAITGNTYIHAVCHEVKRETPSTPEPEYVQVECLTSQPGAYINSKVKASNNMEFIFDAKMNLDEWCRCFGYWNNGNSGLAFQSANNQHGGDLMFYASDGTNTYQYANSGVDIKEKTTYDVKYAGTEEDASFIKVNGTTVKYFTTGSINTNKEIAIFTLTSDDMASGDDKKPLSIYYMQIYKDGELVRDYIPVKTLKEIDKSRNAIDDTSNISANTLCFYDKVTKKYYLNSGDKSFTITNKITLSANDADNKSDIQATVDVIYCNDMTKITGQLPKRTGYTFLGYYDGTGDNAKKYYNFDGTSATTWDKTGRNFTLYARWDACEYNITYKDKNGGLFSGTHAEGYPEKHTYGITTKLKGAIKDGYNFIGWFINEDCSEAPITSLDGQSYTENITLYADWEFACLAKGTLITMADGTRELIENINRGDLVRVFNHDTGKVSSAKIMDYWQYEEKKSGLITLHFTNDIDVNIVTAHGFYNKEDNKYVVLCANNINSYIGKHFYNVDNDCWETLLGATYSDEKVDTFFIATEGQLDTVAEGMLNIEDGLYYVLRNTYDFDENLKIDENKKASDIQRYGLFENSDFEYLTKEAFEEYGAANLKVAIGKGIVTEDYLDMIRAESITYESDNIVEEFIPENVQHSVK